MPKSVNAIHLPPLCNKRIKILLSRSYPKLVPSHTHMHVTPTPCIPILLSHIVEYVRLVESIEVRMSRQRVCSHLFKVQPVTHVELREQGITNLVCTVTGWTPQTGEEQRSGLVLCKKRRKSTIKVSSKKVG